MSWAMRKASRDTLSWNPPFSASRGAKAMACTRPSSESHFLPSCTNNSSICASSATSQANSRSVPNALALVGEGELGALAGAGFRDSVGDRAVGKHPGHQDPPVLQEAHDVVPFPVELMVTDGVEVYRIIPAAKVRRCPRCEPRAC